MKLGVDVYRPVGEGSRYDLIFDLPSGLTRVQCKWAPRAGDVVTVRCYSCRRTAEGLRSRTYTTDEIDAFAAYCAEVDRCYLLPLNEVLGMREVQLRLAPARNGQRAGINWAEDYSFDARLGRSRGRSSAGRARGWQPRGQGFEPPRLHSPNATVIGAHELRERFGWYVERAAGGEEILVTRRGRPHVRLTSYLAA